MESPYSKDLEPTLLYSLAIGMLAFCSGLVLAAIVALVTNQHRPESIDSVRTHSGIGVSKFVSAIDQPGSDQQRA